ncbi:MAG: hypothetical protein ABSE16_18425 [Verrucomicrobiota bacterium]|jgi:hypothetical protein
MFSQGTITIQYNGLEQSLAEWGLTSNCHLSLKLNDGKKFTAFMAGKDPAAVLPFPFEAPVTIREYGAAGAVVFAFIGYHTTPKGTAVTGRTGVTLTFEDTWYKFRATKYTQLWPIPNTSPQQYYTFLRCWLYQDPNAQDLNYHMSFQQQITDIVQYAQQNCGINCQVGTIDNPQIMPWDGVRCISLADAIKQCLRWFPGMRTWFDDSSGTPVFNCRFRANCTTVTLPYAGMMTASGAQTTSQAAAQYIHKQTSEITPRYDLQCTGVVLQYVSTEDFDGVDYPVFSQVVYPPGTSITNDRIVAAIIDLRGSRVTSAKGKVTAQVFNPTSLDFWRGNPATGQRGKVPSLGDTDCANLAFVGPVTVTDVNGNPVNLATYPNEHHSGAVFSWMTLESGGNVNLLADVRVTAQFSYQRTKQIGATTINRESHNAHTHSVNVRLTNSPIGTQYYSAYNSINFGELPVAGLEETIYNDRSVLAFSGSHEIIELGTPPIIGPFNLLTLVGGNAAWIDMDIYGVESDFCAPAAGSSGVAVWRNTTIQIGPPKHLSPQELNQYEQLFRGRVITDLPSERITGQEGNQVDVSSDAPVQDTTPNTPDEYQHTVSFQDPESGNTLSFTHDASQGQITYTEFAPGAAGPPATGGAPIVTAYTGRVFSGQGNPNYGGSGNPVLAAIKQYQKYDRYFDLTNAQSPVEWLCTFAGTNETSTWVQIGGGGSTTVRLWIPTSTAANGSLWVLQSGPAMGLYMSTAGGNNNSPDTGINWVQLSGVLNVWQ